MSGKTIVLLVIVNGFVALVWFRGYQSGMPLLRAIGFGALSMAAVTLATILGGRLGDARARQIAQRKGQRK